MPTVRLLSYSVIIIHFCLYFVFCVLTRYSFTLMVLLHGSYIQLVGTDIWSLRTDYIVSNQKNDKYSTSYLKPCHLFIYLLIYLFIYLTMKLLKLLVSGFWPQSSGCWSRIWIWFARSGLCFTNSTRLTILVIRSSYCRWIFGAVPRGSVLPNVCRNSILKRFSIIWRFQGSGR